MGMAQASTTWTGERVRALPDDGLRDQLVDGEPPVTPSPGWAHQTAVATLFRRLDGHVGSNALGWVRFAPADLSLGEDEVLQPDLFVIPAALNPRSWQEVRALLLVIEVLSPGTARYDRLVKRRRYQRAPVPEYWIVDLDARLVERWKPLPHPAWIPPRRSSGRPSLGSNRSRLSFRDSLRRCGERGRDKREQNPLSPAPSLRSGRLRAYWEGETAAGSRSVLSVLSDLFASSPRPPVRRPFVRRCPPVSLLQQRSEQRLQINDQRFIDLGDLPLDPVGEDLRPLVVGTPPFDHSGVEIQDPVLGTPAP